MSLPQSQQKVRRVRQKPRLAEVVRVECFTPHMVRVVFAGEELVGFTTRGPAEHLKVNFPPPGESTLVLPEWGPEGADPFGRSAATIEPHLHAAAMESRSGRTERRLPAPRRRPGFHLGATGPAGTRGGGVSPAGRRLQSGRGGRLVPDRRR